MNNRYLMALCSLILAQACHAHGLTPPISIPAVPEPISSQAPPAVPGKRPRVLTLDSPPQVDASAARLAAARQSELVKRTHSRLEVRYECQAVDHPHSRIRVGYAFDVNARPLYVSPNWGTKSMDGFLPYAPELSTPFSSVYGTPDSWRIIAPRVHPSNVAALSIRVVDAKGALLLDNCLPSGRAA